MYVFIGPDDNFMKRPSFNWFRKYLQNHDNDFWDQGNGESVLFKSIPFYMFWKKAYVSYMHYEGTIKEDPLHPKMLIRQPKDGFFYIEIGNNVPYFYSGNSKIIEAQCHGESFPILEDSLINTDQALHVINCYLAGKQQDNSLNWVKTSELPIDWCSYF